MENNEVKLHIKSLKKTRDELLGQAATINSAISALEGNTSSLIDTSANGTTEKPKPKVYDSLEYGKGWPNKRKVLFFLKQADRFLHFREVAEMIINQEGIKTNSKNLASILSGACHDLKKSNTIVKFQAGKSNHTIFWGSPKWLNEDGKIKEGYEYNPEYLTIVKRNSGLKEIEL